MHNAKTNAGGPDLELSPNMEEKTIEVDGRRVHYTARGPEDAPYVYLGLNGLMGGGDSFWPVIEGVPDDWRVVLPDLPGCGGSKTMPPPHKHNIEGYARWLDRFLTALGLHDRKLVLASVATGAPIAIRYTMENMERVTGLVLHMPFLGKSVITAKLARPIVAYALLIPPMRELVDRLRNNDRLMHRIIIHEPPRAIPELAERDIHHKQEADLLAAGELLHDLMLTDSRAELPYIRQPHPRPRLRARRAIPHPHHARDNGQIPQPHPLHLQRRPPLLERRVHRADERGDKGLLEERET